MDSHNFFTRILMLLYDISGLVCILLCVHEHVAGIMPLIKGVPYFMGRWMRECHNALIKGVSL